MLAGQGVAELVALVARDRPFLGEGVEPVFAVPETGKAGNVLDHSIALVVGLFDQEAIVLDRGLGDEGGARILLWPGGSGQKGAYQDQAPAKPWGSHTASW